jgi:hypothetical protein
MEIVVQRGSTEAVASRVWVLVWAARTRSWATRCRNEYGGGLPGSNEGSRRGRNWSFCSRLSTLFEDERFVEPPFRTMSVKLVAGRASRLQAPSASESEGKGIDKRSLRSTGAAPLMSIEAIAELFEADWRDSSTRTARGSKSLLRAFGVHSAADSDEAAVRWAKSARSCGGRSRSGRA